MESEISGLRGFVDNVFDNVIAGWAVNGDKPAAVDLFIDGTFVSRTPSVRMRTDLISHVSPHGYVGFNVLVPGEFCDGTDKLVRITFAETDEVLGHGELTFNQRREFRPPQVVVFPNPAHGETARKMLSLLAPMDVVGGRLIRVGGINDGGYIMLDHGLDNSICYSFGINDDVFWDLELAQRGSTIFQYDHTIEMLPIEHPSFHWQKSGIAAQSSPDNLFKSISDIVAERDAGGEAHSILKCDIEGHEWTALSATSSSVLKKFSQILMEIHALTLFDDEEHVTRVLESLEKLNESHQLIHVHANNCGRYVLAGGVGMPDTYEVTYVRRADHDFVPTDRVYPCELDRPCSDMAADYFLGRMGLN